MVSSEYRDGKRTVEPRAETPSAAKRIDKGLILKALGEGEV
jgi:hypothetical protein